MNVLKRMIMVLVAVAASSGLANAVHAAERGHGGSVANHATRHLGIGHPVFGRHDAHPGRHYKQRYRHGYHRHYRHHRMPSHHRYHHRGGHRYRHYGKRMRKGHYGHRFHGYGIWIELDGLRYYIGK